MAKKPKSEGGAPPRKKLVAPTTRGYSNKEMGRPKGRGPGDDRTIRLDAPTPVEVYRPKYNAGATVIRPFPLLSYDDPDNAFEPYRYSLDEYDTSPFIVRVPAVKYTGGKDNKITFLLYDPKWAKDSGYDGRNHPYNILFYKTKQFVESGNCHPGWNPLIMGDKLMTPPTYLYYLQGLIYEQGGQAKVGGGKVPIGAGKDDKPVVLQLSSGTGQKITELLNEQRPEYNGPTKGADVDFEKALKYGDPVALKDGRFFRIINPKLDVTAASDDSPKGEERFADWKQGGASNSKGDDDGERGYAVSILKNYSTRGDKYHAHLDA